jgi:hypothetical protein
LHYGIDDRYFTTHVNIFPRSKILASEYVEKLLKTRV